MTDTCYRSRRSEPTAKNRSSSVCRLRGLPFNATETDIVEFFADFEIKHLHICRRAGRATGEAYVEFASRQQSEKALVSKNNHNLQHRYIEIFEVPEADLSAMQRSGSAEAHLRGWVLRMRGLPYTATAADVLAFFEGLEIARGAAGVVFTCTADGRPLGEAYVELTTEAAQQEALKRHKEKMGSRYIELFVSSKGDMLQAIQLHGYYADQPESAVRGTASQQQQQQLMPANEVAGQQSQPYHRSQGEVREGSDTLRLRGLPFSAGVDEITEFFSGFSLAPRSIHILSKTDRTGRVQSMGVAYVQFEDANEAERARAAKHKATMGTRYVECLAYHPERHMAAAPPPPPHAMRAAAMAMAQPGMVPMAMAQPPMVPIAVGMQPAPGPMRPQRPISPFYMRAPRMPMEGQGHPHSPAHGHGQPMQALGNQGALAPRRGRGNGRGNGGRGPPAHMGSPMEQQQMLMQQQYMLQQQNLMYQQQQAAMAQGHMQGFEAPGDRSLLQPMTAHDASDNLPPSPAVQGAGPLSSASADNAASPSRAAFHELSDSSAFHSYPGSSASVRPSPRLAGQQAASEDSVPSVSQAHLDLPHNLHEDAQGASQ
ncbi:hypothetical protein WJX73_002890 [Symbiochloris irregularis]|uniref:RRM domain-containing protein n=1 Tax=Symbiochloris irregularis TaxID=706552 RepID=A0AAW1PIF3_9CHLO